MKTLQKIYLAFSVLALCSLPAMASVTVYSPQNGATVAPQFSLSAAAPTCSNQSVSAMGFSLDNSSNTTIINGTSIKATVTSTTGSHTLHVKAWGNAGASCVTDVSLNVSASNNGVSVSAPGSGATVTSPFTVTADALYCSSLPVTAMGYSLDYGSTAIVNGTAVNASVPAATGAHTLHVKAWANNGAVCVSDVPITVAAPQTTTSVSTSSSTSNGITVYAPTNNATVNSPFALQASVTSCSSQTVSAMGYSLDNSSSTAIVQSTSVSASVTATTGPHTLHVKAWGNNGSSCVNDIAINVTSGTTTSTSNSTSVSSLVPSYAASVSSIQTLGNWTSMNDPGAGGNSSGSMSLTSSPSLSGSARQFNTSFSSSGGHLYYVVFGDDTTAHNFFYDAWLYLNSSVNNIGNIEMDMNQVTSNGQTVLYGFQCDGYSGTWDYTINAGTAANPIDQWVHSAAGCNPRSWAINTWHHVQISYSRDDYGNITYKSVWLDGVESPINATAFSSFALGWSPVLLTNFQVDGMGSGSNTVYLDKLTISRW